MTSQQGDSTLRQRGYFQLHMGQDVKTKQSTPPSPSRSHTSSHHINLHGHTSTLLGPVQQRHTKTLLTHQSFHARQSTNMRKFILWVTTTFALILAFVIGYFQHSVAILFILVVVMVLVWRDQSRKVVREVEQETEIRLRRRSTVQHSETAEWVNMAINRWWMACSGSVVDFLKDYVEPLLQDMAPVGVESIELVEFDLADQTPFVKTIRLFDPPTAHPGHAPGGEYTIAGPHSPTRRTVVANLDVGLLSPDSQLVLRARLGGKRVGCSTLVYVEGLHLSGSMQAVVAIDYEAPFPHIASITSTFVRKPDVWFTVKVLKGLQVTEIPLLKNWVHSFITDVFTTLMVDPGKLTFNFTSSGPLGYHANDSLGRARGVLTVTIRGHPPENKSAFENDPRRWCSLHVGQQKVRLQLPTRRRQWRGTHSFLVYDTQQDVLVIKIKHRRVWKTVTLALHCVTLDTLPLTNEEGEEAAWEGSRYLHNSEAKLSLDLEYTPLPPFSLDSKNHFSTSQVAGVLYVHVHSGSDLLSISSDGLSDPYCVILGNKKKILTTHYVLDSLNPEWERGMEVFVADFTQVSLTFVVYDWDGPLVGDDLLGVAKLNLVQKQPELLRHELELEIDGNTSRNGQPLGHITVSVVFRPVDSVVRTELPSVPSVILVGGGEEGVGGGEEGVRGSPPLPLQVKRVAKMLKPRRSQYYGGGICSRLGVVELMIVQGRDLVPKDSHGFSDPYVVVKYGSEIMFKTRVMKKTLNPEWNESATLSAPHSNNIVRVECWNKDFYSDDSMGSMQFTQEDLVQFQDGPKWCQLENVRSGELLIGIKRIVPKVIREGSRPLVEDNASTDSSVVGSESIPVESNSDSGSIQMQQSTTSGSSIQTGSSHSQSPDKMKRRHTVSYTGQKPRPLPTHHHQRSHDDTTSVDWDGSKPWYPESQVDAERTMKDSSSIASKRSSIMERSGRPRQPTVYHNIAGQVIEADGLKGELDHLELYIKVRLNSRPSYQRQQKFGRGPTIHKTRVLRGTSNPQWREDFMVRESPVPSDSLLTVDLKSGSKVNIGTHAITLDRFFEGNLKTVKWLDIGNDMKLRIRLSRQPTPTSSQ